MSTTRIVVDAGLKILAELRFYQGFTAVLFWSFIIAAIHGDFPWWWALAVFASAFFLGFVSRHNELRRQGRL